MQTLFTNTYRATKNTLDDCVLSTVSLSEAAVSQSKYQHTSFYISPEQNNRGEYGQKVDVYALGIIFFEMNYPFSSVEERCKVI